MKSCGLHLSELSTVEFQLGGDWKKVIKMALQNKVDLFICLKKDLSVSYEKLDYDESYDGTPLISRTENVKVFNFTYGEVFTVPVDALEQIWLGNSVLVQQILPRPEKQYGFGDIVSETQAFDKADLLIKTDDIGALNSKARTKRKRSPTKINPLKEAICLALQAIDKNASNEEIYTWIKKQTESRADTGNPFINIDFEGYTPLCSATNKDYVVSYYLAEKNKKITKKTFQNIAAENKKKKIPVIPARD